VKKIDGVDDREIVGKTEHSGVVARGDSDEQIRMARQIEPREDCREVRRTELTGSTRSLAPRRQANQVAPRGIVVLCFGHREYCRASQRRSQPRVCDSFSARSKCLASKKIRGPSASLGMTQRRQTLGQTAEAAGVAYSCCYGRCGRSDRGARLRTCATRLAGRGRSRRLFLDASRDAR